MSAKRKLSKTDWHKPKKIKVQDDASRVVQSSSDLQNQLHTAGQRSLTWGSTDGDMRKQASHMDIEMNWRQEPSSGDLEMPLETSHSPYSQEDSEMILRREPAHISMEVTSLKQGSSQINIEMKSRETSTVAMKMCEGHSSMNLDKTVRRQQTVIMLEDNVNTHREQSVLDLEMSNEKSSRAYTIMSMGNEQSVMDTDYQRCCSNMEVGSQRQETLNETEMSIKEEPSEMESDLNTMKEASLLETSVSIKTEPSLFDVAFDDDDDSMSPAPREMSSVHEMSQTQSSSQIKVEPGLSSVEEYADGVDKPVPLLRARYTVKSEATDYAERPVPLIRARYTVKSEAPSEAGTSSVFAHKLVVKLKTKAASRYQPYSEKGKRLQVKSKRQRESISPSPPDTGIVIKCEPMSDSDTELNQKTADESATRETKQKKSHQRATRRKSPPVCSHCQTLFCSRSSLKRHFKRKHSTESLAFSCSYCDSKFSRLIQLRAHERLHRGGDKTFPCQECDVVFTRACHLKVHMRKHTGERPYTCSVADCKATFHSTSNLNRHMMKHSGLRPYICTVCNANFYQSSHLVSHIRKHTGERPFACKKCEATFTQLTHLHRHMAKHTGKKPHVCSTCGLGFVENCALKRHMETHNKHLQSTRLSKLNTKKKTVSNAKVPSS